MAHDMSDYLLLGGLAIANAAAGLAVLGVNLAWLAGLGGFAALAVTAGAAWKLFA